MLEMTGHVAVMIAVAMLAFDQQLRPIMTVVTNSGLITDLDLWMFGRRSVVLNYLVLEEDELCEQVVELTFGGTEMLTEKRNEFITEKLT